MTNTDFIQIERIERNPFTSRTYELVSYTPQTAVFQRQSIENEVSHYVISYEEWCELGYPHFITIAVAWGEQDYSGRAQPEVETSGD